MRVIEEAIVKRSSDLSLDLNTEKKNLESIYTLMADKASAVDATLNKHVAALQTKALERIVGLEKKMMRAEKKKV
ncbi:MAG: bacillithiol biosynthesis BshC [Ferruginibacter sp.]